MPAEDTALASSLPVLPGLTPHGLRHGHQRWMDGAGIPDVLKSERMGHEVPGMRGVYGHVSPSMRAELTAALQERWQTALRERARLSPRSIVPVLDALLATQLLADQRPPRPGHDTGLCPGHEAALAAMIGARWAQAWRIPPAPRRPGPPPAGAHDLQQHAPCRVLPDA